jgi:hypothetical protein
VYKKGSRKLLIEGEVSERGWFNLASEVRASGDETGYFRWSKLFHAHLLTTIYRKLTESPRLTAAAAAAATEPIQPAH